ncbi:MAG: hypothetical protein ABI767_07660 [Rhodanobacter sp.]
MGHSLYRCACALGLTLTLLAPCTTAAGSPTASAVHYFEGKAINPSTGKLMYTEAHWVHGDAGDSPRLVLYRCPDGKPFARKRIQANGHPQAPDFALTDARDGYREGARSEGVKRIVYVRKDERSKERTATLETLPMPVIDAGFDVYIRSHWNSLGKDGSDTIPFVIPSRLGTLRFKVKRVGDAMIGGRQSRQYQLGLASWIGFALPHLTLAYDEKTRELLRFEGMANIRSNDGDNVKARIVFDPGTDKVVSQADLHAASDVPLDGDCPIP